MGLILWGFEGVGAKMLILYNKLYLLKSGGDNDDGDCNVYGDFWSSITNFNLFFWLFTFLSLRNMSSLL